MTTSTDGTNLTTYTYSDDGNLAVEQGSTTTTNTYDKENRLTSVGAVGSLSTYTYGADGLRRTANESEGSLVTFVWDGDQYLGEV